MKKLLLLSFAILVVASCKDNNAQRYTQTSPEIDIIKSAINNYDFQKWDSMAMKYNDTAQIFYNTRKNPFLPKDMPAYHNSNDANFSTRAFEDDRREYEMIVDDDGDKWVNFWGIWEGNLAANNKKIVIPVHITYQFNKGKIVREYGYWNTSELVLELQAIEEAEKLKNELDLE